MRTIENQLKKESSVYRRFYKGFEYWILRPSLLFNPLNSYKKHNFHLCGYVVIERGGEYYYDDYDDIECHGGITFSDSIEDLDIDFAIGFDCAHYYDFNNIRQLSYEPLLHHYRDVKYVDKECKFIIDQLINRKKGDR